MKTILLALAALALTACSTTNNRAAVAATTAATEDEVFDDAWRERNGPSDSEREGWVQPSSGWFRSYDACLRYDKKVGAGTPLAYGEGCIEAGI